MLNLFLTDNLAGKLASRPQILSSSNTYHKTLITRSIHDPG